MEGLDEGEVDNLLLGDIEMVGFIYDSFEGGEVEFDFKRQFEHSLDIVVLLEQHFGVLFEHV